ncbi:hypothetical protein RhiirA1_479500 [Rhizophagus irregularis]|uniref:Uncharacterized protein n=1 Tax=Rhizophagus irregularis TaxID=588596 RepID=A0A2N0QQL2_9GLOM|nr:hypothetical protein RhiirA1_479500 [Rhizophagus irregularis]
MNVDASCMHPIDSLLIRRSPMFHIELHNALWLFIVVFMLHDFEEIITVENWSQKTYHLVKNSKSNLKLLIWKFWNINSHSFAKRDEYGKCTEYKLR